MYRNLNYENLRINITESKHFQSDNTSKLPVKMDFFRFPAVLRSVTLSVSRLHATLKAFRLVDHPSLGINRFQRQPTKSWFFGRGIFGSRGIFHVANIASEIPVVSVSKSWNLTVNRRINKLNCTITRVMEEFHRDTFLCSLSKGIYLFIYLFIVTGIVSPAPFYKPGAWFSFCRSLVNFVAIYNAYNARKLVRKREKWWSIGKRVLKQNPCALTFSYSLYAMDLFN